MQLMVRMAAMGRTRAAMCGLTMRMRVVRHRGGRVLQLVWVVRGLSGIVVRLLLRTRTRVAVVENEVESDYRIDYKSGYSPIGAVAIVAAILCMPHEHTGSTTTTST